VVISLPGNCPGAAPPLAPAVSPGVAAVRAGVGQGADCLERDVPAAVAAAGLVLFEAAAVSRGGAAHRLLALMSAKIPVTV
jgi:hypothetical protein